MMRLNNLPIRFACIAIAAVVMNPLAAVSPLDYKTFVNGSALWICNPAGIHVPQRYEERPEYRPVRYG